ncbi:MAG: FHA domain-containing protein [Oscillatoriales cyanobacterium SM2_1_8]|nr:FHA domain-containing protein [Oscillatoriales cyanobacterium SM2_1_8]
MIVCPSCDHVNPAGALTCEACFSSLPQILYTQCPSCSAEVQPGAKFCGNCGFDLQQGSQPVQVSTEAATPEPSEEVPEPVVTPLPDDETDLRSRAAAAPARTQLQQISAYLMHLQTETRIELPTSVQVIHIGKPNNLIPPDIDVSGFPDSDIVSRVHGDIRYEGDAFYFEDTGSSNGTYINNVPLPPGNRHRLRAGDRIALGKGDKVSFVFQMG